MTILVVIDLFKVRNLSTFILNSNSNKQDFCSHQINKIMSQSNLSSNNQNINGHHWSETLWFDVNKYKEKPFHFNIADRAVKLSALPDERDKIHDKLVRFAKYHNFIPSSCDNSWITN